MQSVKERITGFYLRPKFMKLGKKEYIRELEIEYLEDGNIISKEKLGLMKKEELNKIQEKLLKNVSINLKINESVEESCEISKTGRRIGVVNMFKIEIKYNEDSTMNIKIVFIKNGYFALESSFNDVTNKKLEEIRYFLIDNTKYNFTCDKQCRAVDVLDMLAIINHKLQN